MPTHLIRKLEQFTPLSADDKKALKSAASRRIRHLGPKEDIICEGDRPQSVNLILEGWACRYKYLQDGRRQIMAFLLPGDVCDLRMFILEQMDHSIGTISQVVLGEVPQDTILELTDNYPRIRRALWWSSLVEEAISREWIVNNSQRNATERMASLFCELFIRLRLVGLADGHSCEIPITQAELGDTVGLSTVHVNRTLQDLRAANLIVFRGKTLTIPDLESLQAVAMFNPNYLHLEREGGEFEVNEA